MHFPKSIIALLILVACSLAGIAQTARVKGQVKDTDGMPVEFATIVIKGTGDGATADEKGKFELDIPANRQVVLEVRHTSFQNIEVKVKGEPGEVVSVNPKLKFKVYSGRSFTKEAERDRERPMQQIEVKDARLNPSVTGSVEALLPSMALGVQTNNELSSQYSVRGGNFDENMIYVNGVLVYRPFLVRSGQQEGLSFVNGDLVQDISFSSGGFEAKYGDKMSSVLDITYKKPEKFGGSVSAGLLGANAHIENRSDNSRFTQLHGFRYYSNQYLLGSLDVSGDYRPYFIDYQTYLTYAFSQEWEISFLGNYSQNKYQFTPVDRTASFGTVSSAVGLNVFFEGSETDNYQTSFGAFTATWKPQYNLKMRFIASAFQTKESETFDIEGYYRLSELETDLSKESFGDEAFVIGVGSYLDHARNYLDALVTSGEVQGEYRGDAHSWLWGLRYQRDDIIDRLSEWSLIDSVGYSVPYDGQQVNLFETIRSFNHIATNRLMGYLQRDWRFELDSHEIYLSTGGRFHYWDLNGQTTVSPRILTSIKPNWKADWQFRASWGYYHQPAFYREMRDLFGLVNPEIRAQTSIHYLVGTDHNFRMFDRPFKFVSEAYYKQLKDIIPYELDNVRIRYYAENNANGYATGIDLKLNGEFVKGIESWASLSILKTAEDLVDDVYFLRLNAAGDTIYNGVTADQVAVDSIEIRPGFIPRPTDQRVSFALTFQDYLPRNKTFRMHLSIIFGTGLPTGPPSYTRYKDVFRMPPYRRVDIGFSARLKDEEKESSKPVLKQLKSAWVTLEVFNLLAVNNTISYLWVKDSRNIEYGVPNYLTGRRVNLKFIAKF